MKNLTTSEKMALLEYHGACLAGAFKAVQSPGRQEMIEHAERALALVKAIPKVEFAIDQP